MINKRLIAIVPKSKKYILINIALQCISLISNILLMYLIANGIEKLIYKEYQERDVLVFALLSLLVVISKFFSNIKATEMSFKVSVYVKTRLRELIYTKLMRIGLSYRESINTSSVVQLAVEGVEQLETYFSAYLPQLFYALASTFILFFTISSINIKISFILFLLIPAIPISIVCVQKIAKKLLAKYWNQYTSMGDSFLENLQGLSTLKVFKADAYKHKMMNEEAEKFRKITMRVLTMQLNSITIMDLFTYGGIALAIMLSIQGLGAKRLGLAETLFIILLANDFFLPMRLLGSFFHVAMNGMAASEKIFKLLNLEEPKPKEKFISNNYTIEIKDLYYSYDNKEVLNNINMSIKEGQFIAIVGESGCGKSTLASIICGKNKNYRGVIELGELLLNEINEANLSQNITYVSNQSYLFKGTVRDNLLMGNQNVSEAMMWTAVESVNLANYLSCKDGLDTRLEERANNFSGGQKQRLALARALIHDSPIYIFDEASSNIDVESENIIMSEIIKLAEKKTVILISHRLANVVNADYIYVMKEGQIVEEGKHNDLLKKKQTYKELWDTQEKLEKYLDFDSCKNQEQLSL